MPTPCERDLEASIQGRIEAILLPMNLGFERTMTVYREVEGYLTIEAQGGLSPEAQQVLEALRG
jgi:hypothetical protein